MGGPRPPWAPRRRDPWDIHFFNYDNFIFFGNFNADVSDKAMLNFREYYDPKSLIKQPTCFKNSKNPSCIGLF